MSLVLSNGPLEKQILLMKLSHEMANRPNFGESVDNNPNSESRHWMARVGAIMKRVGITEGVNWRTAVGMCAQHWVYSTNNMQNYGFEVIEELKLDLELSNDAQIGKIYDKNQRLEFTTDLLAIFANVDAEIFLIDPYLDAEAFSVFFGQKPIPRSRIIMGKGVDAIRALARKAQADFGAELLIRSSREIHDRVLVVDNTDCWLISGSIKDGGNKPTSLMPLPPDLAQRKIQIYEGIWDKSNEGK